MTALDEIIADEDMVALAALVAVIVPVKAAADAAMTALEEIVADVDTVAKSTEPLPPPVIATIALAAIIALLEIVADAIDVGLLVMLDQSTELAVLE